MEALINLSQASLKRSTSWLKRSVKSPGFVSPSVTTTQTFGHESLQTRDSWYGVAMFGHVMRSYSALQLFFIVDYDDMSNMRSTVSRTCRLVRWAPVLAPASTQRQCWWSGHGMEDSNLTVATIICLDIIWMKVWTCKKLTPTWGCTPPPHLCGLRTSSLLTNWFSPALTDGS